MSVKVVNVGLDGMIRETARLSRDPGGAARAALDATLHAAFDDTQARTHVVSGRLKQSGWVTSHTFDGEWEGRISYGDGLDYATFAMAEGSNMFANLPSFGAGYEAALDFHLRGE